MALACGIRLSYSAEFEVLACGAGSAGLRREVVSLWYSPLGLACRISLWYSHTVFAEPVVLAHGPGSAKRLSYQLVVSACCCSRPFFIRRDCIIRPGLG